MNPDRMSELVEIWGLVGMTILFVVLCAWPFLPGMSEKSRRAANSILQDEEKSDD